MSNGRNSFELSRDLLFPHSPDVKDRESSDGGFSRGWGMHFQPNEEYWVDCHNHIDIDPDSGDTRVELNLLLDAWFARLSAFRLGKVLAIASEPARFHIYEKLSACDSRFGWLVYIPCGRPDMNMLKDAVDKGAVGLKLHNAPIMKGQVPPDIWFNKGWPEIFSFLQDKGIPVLWHVTQRKSRSPYHGGGENSYWSECAGGNEPCTNEELLQNCLKILKAFPGLKIIGAHQLHIGLDRLAMLLDEHQNLYIDSSCGFFLRWADILYDRDREVLLRFFLKYGDRILFGSDTDLSMGLPDEYLFQSFLCHTRFINRLRLPYDVLQKVAHENAERVFGLKPVVPEKKGNSRP